jgi:hypothetical protein
MITSISLVQTNKIGSNNIMAIHSPLIFIARAVYGGVSPESLDVEVYNDVNFLLETFKATPFKDETLTERWFMFNADSVLKKYMPKFDDVNQSTYSALYLPNYKKYFTIKFKDDTGLITADLSFYACNAARQYGETEALADVWNNSAQKLYAFLNREFYVHFFYKLYDSPGSISINEATVANPEVGVYRYKGVEDTGASLEVKMLNSEEDLLAAQTVILLPDCPSGLFVKFLDSKTGFYKHWLFNRYYSSEDNHKKIGSVVKLRQNLLEPSELSIGRTVSRQISAVADSLDANMLEYLSPLFTSPRIYIKDGSQWLLTNIADGTTPVKWRKANGGSVSVTFEADKRFTVTMI